MRALVFGTALLFSVTAAASADPLAGSALPQDAHWVVHIDVDGARNVKPLWGGLSLKLREANRPELALRLAAFEGITGMRLPDDLRDVTLYGSEFDEDAVCLRIHGKMDKAGITAVLAKNKDFLRQDYNGHDILQWRDKSRDSLMYVSFPKDNFAVLAPERKTIEAALDLADGNTPALKVDSPLNPPAESATRAAPFIWIAADSLSNMPGNKVESPLLLPMNAASIAVRWSNDRLSAEARVQARNAEAAQQLQAVAEGIKAFVALSAQGSNGAPRMRLLSEILAPLKVQSDGNVVKGEWAIDQLEIEKLLNVAATGPAAAESVTTPLP